MNEEGNHSSEENMDSEETEENSSSSSSSSSSTESDEEFKTGKITLKARKDRRSRGKWKLLSTKKKFKKEWLTIYCKFNCNKCILKKMFVVLNILHIFQVWLGMQIYSCSNHNGMND